MVTDDNRSESRSPALASAKPTPRTGFARLVPAIRHSVAGIRATLKTETAFRQEIAAFVILFPLALWLGKSSVEKVLLAAPLFLVLICELLNTALESAVDRWGEEYNEFTKAAKDAGSAAVFISLMLALFTWVTVLVVPFLF
jgi:diacylglycerol kinase (ATP)